MSRVSETCLSPGSSPPSPQQAALRLAIVALAYVITGRLGLSIPYVGSNITLVWLPTGIAVAALVRWGAGYWPGIYIAALAVNLSIGSPWPVAAGIAVGNTLGPLLATALMRRTGFHPLFDRQRDIGLFCLAAAAGMLVSASGGVACLWLGGALPVPMLASAWLTWWLGDSVGVLLAAPVLLTFNRKNRIDFLRRRSELLAWVLVMAAVAWEAFILNQGDPGQALPLAFLTLPLVVWAALRFGITGASLAVLGLSLMAAWGTASGRGPFTQADMHQGLVLLWAYMSTSVLMGLLIPSLEAEIHSANERLSGLIEAIPDAIFFKDGEGRLRIINAVAQRLFQFENVSWQGRTEEELAILRPPFRDAHGNCARSDAATWAAGRLALFEERIVDAAGQPRMFEIRKVPTFEKDGRRKGLIIIGRDLTEEHNARREIERLSERNQLLLMAAADGIFGVDRQSRATFINPAGLRLLGYTAEEVVGANPHLLFHHHRPDGRAYPEAECPVLQTLHTGESCQDISEWFIRKDGSFLPVSLTAAPIYEQGERTGVVVTFQDATQRQEAEAEIHRLAFYDPLTALPNRRLLHDRLQKALASSARYGSHGAVLFLDLDNFKSLNDTQGHHVGDLLLSEVAGRLVDSVRSEDTVARLGGDEFVVMLENLSPDPAKAASQAEIVGEKIRLALNRPYRLQGAEHHSTPSIGISLFLGEAESADELLKHADVALYKAKGAGRNTVRFFDPAMQAALDTRASLENELRQAIQAGHFELHYQPQIDSRTGILGAEALLRWCHPQRGPVPPMEFIPLAEETGLILPIGQWVLETACARLKEWEASPAAAHLQLAVNISARQFRQQDFVTQVQAVLAATGANPRRLKLELTESLMLDSIGEVIDKMQALRSLGIGFSMDDFGTGYSSLSYLKQLPLEQLKIDQSFIHNLTSNAADAAIVRTIIGVAQSLDLGVIAEGVETADQQRFLDQNGCPAYQGYLFSRPMPSAEFEALLAA